jgi:hypothetical protein
LLAKQPVDKLQYLFHLVPVGKVDSAITIEFTAEDYGYDTFVLLLAFEMIPTYRLKIVTHFLSSPYACLSLYVCLTVCPSVHLFANLFVVYLPI